METGIFAAKKQFFVELQQITQQSIILFHTFRTPQKLQSPG